MPQKSPWIVQLFNRAGSQLKPLLDPNAPTLTYTLNSWDTFGFSLPLDHPNAEDLVAYKTVAKVWRRPGGIAPQLAVPDFCGTLYPWTEGGGNIANFTFFSPLWRLQQRFVWDPVALTGKKNGTFTSVDQGQILLDLLDYTNKRDATYLIPGTATKTVNRTRKYAIGQQIWQALKDMTELGSDSSDTAAGILGGVDLVPQYMHIPDDPTLARLDILPVRGAYRPYARIGYYTAPRNAADQTRQSGSSVANYVRARGQSVTIQTKAATKTAAAATAQEPTYDDAVDWVSVDDIGLYETIQDYSNVTDVSLLKAYAEEQLKTGKAPAVTLQPTLLQDTAPIYGRDCLVGDVIPVASNRGRAAYDINMRIASAQLALSDNNAEVFTPTLMIDTTGLVKT